MNDPRPPDLAAIAVDSPAMRADAASRAPALHVGVLLAVVVALVWVLAVYQATMRTMVSLWQNSEMFGHGFAVIPIALYLMWRERRTLATVETRPFYPALGGIALAGAVWLIGDRLRINSVSQYAMMAMVPLVVWTVLGTRASRALAFPLAFLFLAVPFGDFLIPQLMNWTADFTAFAVRESGVPVWREGNYLTLPSGQWAVVEACSGVRYLIASFTVGCLFAYLSFRSPRRRAAFVAASILVPIVANWLRAYMIVMLGHLTSNRIAVGADHLIYGWIFFGVVMALLFWAASRWREDVPAPAVERASQGDGSRVGVTFDRRTAAALAGAAALTALWPIVAATLPTRVEADAPRLAPLSPSDGWTEARPFSQWSPDLAPPTAELRQTFGKDGARVGVYVAFYRDPGQRTKAITSVNELVHTMNPRWREIAAGTADGAFGGERPMRARTAVVAGERERLAVWQWFWVDGHSTSSFYAAKLYEVVSLLRGHGGDAAWVVLYTPTDTDESDVRRTLRAFATDMHGPIEATLRAAAPAR